MLDIFEMANLPEMRPVANPYAPKFVAPLEKSKAPLAPSEKRAALFALSFEEFCLALNLDLSQAKRAHKFWAVRRVVSLFETQVRCFQRRKDNSVIGASDLFESETVEGETMYNGRLMADLTAIMRRYQLPDAEIDEAAEMVRQRLADKWALDYDAPPSGETLEPLEALIAEVMVPL